MPIPNPNPIPNSATLEFQYVVSPTITKTSFSNSNTATSEFNLATISSTKIASLDYADVGDTIVYTIILVNNGNVTANNILFIDTIPDSTSLVEGSFNQDNTPIVESPNPPGVKLPHGVAPGATSTVTFSVVITDIPSLNSIQNSASMTFNFTVIPTIPDGRTNDSNTNTVDTQVSNASLNTSYKFADKPYVTCGDIITYTISVPNTGNVTAINVILRDTIPNGTTFIDGSILVDGIVQPNGITPDTGINIGTIPANSTTTVSFQVIVNCN